MAERLAPMQIAPDAWSPAAIRDMARAVHEQLGFDGRASLSTAHLLTLCCLCHVVESQPEPAPPLAGAAEGLDKAIVRIAEVRSGELPVEGLLDVIGWLGAVADVVRDLGQAPA